MPTDHTFLFRKVFLSETTFTDYFKSRVETFLAHRPSKPHVRWGFVEDKDWKMPEHIDYQRAQTAMEVMGKSNLIPYGGSQTYRQMCRWVPASLLHLHSKTPPG